MLRYYYFLGLLLISIIIVGRPIYCDQRDSTFALESIEKLLTSSVSTASKYEQRIIEAPASVSIISQEDFRRYGYSTLEEVLNTLEGFFLDFDTLGHLSI